MIWDRANDISLVLSGAKWSELCALVISLARQSEIRNEAKTAELMVEGVQVVGNTDTFLPATYSDAPLEAHQKMVDLQLVLAGTERIDVHPVALLREIVAYDDARDMAWYVAPSVPAVTLTMTPGTLALFFPRDAHRPKMAVSTDNDDTVTKIVFKIPVELLV